MQTQRCHLRREAHGDYWGARGPAVPKVLTVYGSPPYALPRLRYMAWRIRVAGCPTKAPGSAPSRPDLGDVVDGSCGVASPVFRLWLVPSLRSVHVAAPSRCCFSATPFEEAALVVRPGQALGFGQPRGEDPRELRRRRRPGLGPRVRQLVLYGRARQAERRLTRPVMIEDRKHNGLARRFRTPARAKVYSRGYAMRILMKIDGTNQDSKWEALAPMEYSHEAELQGLLNTGSAELIPADPSLDEAHVVFAREVSTDSGPIDLIGIGSSGSITIMECKLAKNHQIKREVVGQVLDYAASLWETDVLTLSEAFRARAGSDPFDAIRQQFGVDADSFDEEACRSEVARRLREGDFRLLVAVDRIDPELRRIIQYVNSRGGSGPGLRLVAVEFPRYQQGMIQVLVPEAYGDELAHPKPPTSRGGRRWALEDYFAALAPDSPLAPIVRRLLDWAAERRLTIRMGHGQTPSPSWRLEALGADYTLFAVGVDGRLWLGLGPLRGRPVTSEEPVMRTLIEGLNTISGIKVAYDASGPAVPLLPLAQEEAMAAFTAAWDRVIDAVRAAESRD